MGHWGRAVSRLLGLTALASLCVALPAPRLSAHPRLAHQDAARPHEVEKGTDVVAPPILLPPWNADTLPPWAESVLILEGDQPLRFAPDATADRRGSAMREIRLPLFGARRGPGCHNPWLHVGPSAWVCGDDVSLSGSPPIAAGRPPFQAADGLPFRYYFAGRDGSLAYDRIEEADVGEPAASLEPGFAVAIVAERELAGQLYGLTNRGLWVPMRDFGPARATSFEGSEVSELVDGVIPFAWVHQDRAPVYRRLQSGALVATGASLDRFTKVGYLEESTGFRAGYVRIDEERWLRQRDLRHPTVAPPPDDPTVAAGAHWIDVELETQTLVAYAGERPVFATMVSTGKGRTKGHPFETPKGVHRIWVKLLTTTMDNLEDEYAARYWRMEDVPYVQFFHKGVGLHGAFWHRSFGNIRSHGCVNLTPLDAQRLFWWTGPNLPAGWTAALPGGRDQGGIVRVR